MADEQERDGPAAAPAGEQEQPPEPRAHPAADATEAEAPAVVGDQADATAAAERAR